MQSFNPSVVHLWQRWVGPRMHFCWPKVSETAQRREEMATRLTTFLVLRSRETLLDLGGKRWDLTHLPAHQTGSPCIHGCNRRKQWQARSGEKCVEAKLTSLTTPGI